MSSGSNRYEGLGPVDYIRVKYQELGINKDKWWNAVTIPAENMEDRICVFCRADVDAFNPSKVKRAVYEARFYGSSEPKAGERALCSPYCLWWAWASEQRRLKEKRM